MQLSVSDRRRLTELAGYNPRFRSQLEADPRRAVNEAVGRLFESDKIKLVHEENDWCFLLLDQAEIDPELPEAYDSRSWVENEVYTLLRNRPEMRDGAERDPKGFLAKEFGVELDEGTGIKLYREEPGSAIIIVPNISGREELLDDMLDLVSAGGSPTCDSPIVGEVIRGPTSGT